MLQVVPLESHTGKTIAKFEAMRLQNSTSGVMQSVVSICPSSIMIWCTLPWHHPTRKKYVYKSIINMV